MAKSYGVKLTTEERVRRLSFLKKGKTSARNLCRVQSLLQADTGLSDTRIATTVHVDVTAVERAAQAIRRRRAGGGAEPAASARRQTRAGWAAGSLPDRAGW